MESFPRILVFASGEPEPDKGGSGFENLVNESQRICGLLKADIVGVVSNHPRGGVYTKALKLNVPFFHASPKTAGEYLELAAKTGAEWFMLSGWLKPVIGLPVKRTVNIHPGPAPEFGGKGMYGHHVHEAVLAAYHRREITHSAVTMHFVTKEYDKGPIFLKQCVPILPDDTAETLGKRVNEVEHEVQPMVTSMVVNGEIQCLRLDSGEYRVKAPGWWLRNFVPPEWRY
ncbi:MAG: phosphoribosylglycinamide formyltransferase [Candidatus Kerfeldbacteria bacterium]|nr:phosphoribosylglycinamide formyltransferase [Candidatus Kerfeldbacteria bacterium]